MTAERDPTHDERRPFPTRAEVESARRIATAALDLAGLHWDVPSSGKTVMPLLPPLHPTKASPT